MRLRLHGFCLLFICFLFQTASAQTYSIYVRSQPFRSDVVVENKKIYLPLVDLAKQLELFLNQKDGAEWIGDAPAKPEKSTLYINGHPYPGLLIRNGVFYVEIATFVPAVGYKIEVNDQTRIIDIARKKKRETLHTPISKYATDGVMKHFETNQALYAYLKEIKDWNGSLVADIDNPDYNFAAADNAELHLISNRGVYQDLWTIVDKMADGFKSISDEMAALHDNFPDSDPPKEFAKSHEILIKIKNLCSSEGSAALHAYYTSKGLKVVTEVRPDEYISRLSFAPLLDDLINFIMIDDSMDDLYDQYIKTFHTELAAALLATHYSEKEQTIADLHLPSYFGRLQYYRKLNFKYPVSAVRITPEEEAKSFEKGESEVKPDTLEQDEAILKDFGFIPFYYDTRKVDFKAEAEEVPAYYDPETKHFYFRNDLPEEERDIVFFHELTHALADQYFDLGKLMKKWDSGNSDGQLALRSLMEGDAQYSMTLPVSEDYSLDSNFLGNTIVQLQVGTSFSNTEGPMIYHEDTFFPYSQGMYFVRQLHDWGGWKMVNEAYQDPPESSHEIMHPESYAMVRESPVDFVFPKVPGVKVVADDVMGEFNILTLYATYYHGSKENFSGWRGDRFKIFREKDRDSIVWLSNWMNPEQASEFAARYRDLLTRALSYVTTPPDVRYSESIMRAKFEKVFGSLSTSRDVEETVTGKPRSTISTYTTVVLQKGNTVEILQNIPKEKLAFWKNYADSVTPVRKASATAQTLWPYQDLPRSVSPAAGDKNPLFSALERSKPKSWRLLKTDFSYFPAAVQSPDGNIFYVGHGKSDYPFPGSAAKTAIALFAQHCFSLVEFSPFDQYFGKDGYRYYGLEGEGKDSAGKPVHVMVWVSPSTAGRVPWVMVGQARPHGWGNTEAIFSRMMHSVADFIGGN